MDTEVEIPGIGTVNVSRVIDCRWQTCPKPQVETKHAINTLKEGEIAEILITNPPSITAVKSIIKNMGSTVLGVVQEENLYKLYFKKG